MFSSATVDSARDARRLSTAGSDDMERMTKYLERHAELPPSIKECMLGLLNHGVVRDRESADDMRAIATDDSHDASTLAFMVGTLFRVRATVGKLRLCKDDMPHAQSVLMLKEIKAATAHLLMPKEPSGIFRAPTRASKSDVSAVRGLSDLLELVWRLRQPVGGARLRGAPWKSAATARALMESYERDRALDLHPLALAMLKDPCESTFDRLSTLASHVKAAVMLYRRATTSIWQHVSDYASGGHKHSSKQAPDSDPSRPRTPDRPTKPVKPWAPPRASKPSFAYGMQVPAASGSSKYPGHLVEETDTEDTDTESATEYNGGMDESEAVNAALKASCLTRTRAEDTINVMNVTSGEVIDLVSDEEDAVEHAPTHTDAFTYGGASDSAPAAAAGPPSPDADRPTAAAADEDEVWYVAGGRRGDKGARRHKSRACHHLRTQTHVDTIKAMEITLLKKHKPCKRCKSVAQ